MSILAVFAPGAHAALPAPSLEAPAATAAVEASPTLTWRPVKGAAQYEFQLAADKQFGSVAHAVKTKNTAATLKETLIDGTYYWRVRAISATPKAGRWSTVRSFEKRWATAPQLLSPTPDFGAVWPSAPLVLTWSAVEHATSYIVVVATDPSLAQPVLGTTAKPATTQGTVIAFPGTLNAGTYHWQITPVDTDGHRGTPSAVGRFSWGWPSGLTTRVDDLNPAAEVFDPLLTWSSVPGAAGYDVEVNTTPAFAPGSTFFKATVAGTAVAPTVPVPNNTYFWRVRAVDPDGRAGTYVSGSFRKEFDDTTGATPPRDTVPGLTLRDGATDAALPVGSTTSSPTLSWTPVTGAAEYEVQVGPRDGEVCSWSTRAALIGSGYTRNPFTDLRRVGSPAAANPGAGDWPTPTRLAYPFVDGQAYCVRMVARDGAGARARDARNDSEFTYLGGTSTSNTVGFVYQAPPAVADPGSCPAPLAQPTYLTPTVGQELPRSPRYRWSSVPGAKSYYVVVARDEALTEIVEVVLTDRPFYLPTITNRNSGSARDTYEDEQTSYHWAVWPSPRANGSCFAQRLPSDPAYSRFDKRSVAPVLQQPASGATLADQPVFSWLSAEGAADYRIQVSRDVEFRDLVDNVVTASTTYASPSYPVDTALYWRVRARDANNIELNWSETRQFTRTLPTPVIDPGNPSAGGTIPVLSWSPVPGAISYGFHVDQVDGKAADFTVTTPRFTPTTFYGNGIWKWKVRANFPVSGGSVVSGPYTASTDFVRRILPPANAKSVRTPTRLVFSWSPDTSGKSYRLEVAKDDSFTKKIETVATPNASYAPLLDRGYADGGRLYWRVAILDQGNNLGAFARGDLRLPEQLKVKSKSSIIRRGKRVSMVITVTDPNGKRIRGAKVTASGAGVKSTKKQKKTGKRGTVTLRLRPTRKGTLKVKAAKKGYVTGVVSIKVY